jgi:hypothetical protein
MNESSELVKYTPCHATANTIFLSINWMHNFSIYLLPSIFFEVYILAPSVLWVCFSGLHLCCPLLSAPRAQSMKCNPIKWQVQCKGQNGYIKYVPSVWIINLNFEEQPGKNPWRKLLSWPFHIFLHGIKQDFQLKEKILTLLLMYTFKPDTLFDVEDKKADKVWQHAAARK